MWLYTNTLRLNQSKDNKYLKTNVYLLELAVSCHYYVLSSFKTFSIFLKVEPGYRADYCTKGNFTIPVVLRK